MAEIDRARLKAKLDTIPEHDREPYLLALKAKGYTWRSAAPTAAPGAPESPLTTLGAGKQAIVETMREDIPYLGRAAKALREDIPGAIAETGGAMGFPKTAAALGTVIGTAGELVPKTGLDLALVGAAKPLAAGVKAVGAKGVPGAISALTRIEKPVVERAIARPALLSDKTLLAPDKIEGAIKTLGEGIKAGRRALGQKLGAIEEKLAKTYTGKIQVGDVGQKIAQKFAAGGYAVPGQKSGRIVAELPGEIIDVLADLKKKNLSFRDAANLKRKIGDLVDWDKKKLLGLSNRQEALLKEAYDGVNTRLRAVNPRYAKANDAFARAAKVYDELSADVLSGKPEMIERKLGAMLRKGSAERKVIEKVDRISQEAVGVLDEVFDALTAQRFAPKVNPTLVRAATQTGGGLVGNVAGGALAQQVLGGPTTLGLGAGILAGTSPRLHALGIRAFNAPAGRGALPSMARGGTSAALAALRARRRDDR